MKAPNLNSEALRGWGLYTASFVFKMRRRLATALAIVFAAFLGYHVIFGQNGVTAYQQKRDTDRMLSRQIQLLQDENDRMKQHVEHLKNDPDAIEREARERLHYTRSNEVIYSLNDKPAGAHSGASAPAAR